MGLLSHGWEEDATQGCDNSIISRPETIVDERGIVRFQRDKIKEQGE